MEELRVPKRRVGVEVVLPGGTARRVTVFLAEAAAGHAGPERVADLLNGTAEFFPVVDEASGGIAFLHRAAVALVRVRREHDGDDAEAETLPTEHDVELALTDGAVVRGLVSYVRPPDRARLVDVLNEPAPFLRLLEGEGVALVNKRHVAGVTLRSR
jgi:hypothetical protein